MQVSLFLTAVAAAVVEEPVVAHRSADDLIAGLLAARVVQDGEIVRPALPEETVIRHILPAHRVDFHARLVRGLHFIVKIPKLQRRALGGETFERIAQLELRHAHVGDRILDNAHTVDPDIVGHRALLEVFHALRGIVVHRGVDRVVPLF